MSAREDVPCDSFGDAGCGCCEGIAPRTSRSTPNRPGLSALHYRIGRHADFLDTMKARLSSWNLDRTDCEPAASASAGSAASEPRNPLLELRTRDASDPAIAMLDAWATVADVLTFYQERIANEGFLRTATERRSIVELARLIGYRPRPGVASSLYLAYTIDQNTKEEVVIPAGARSQSVPGPDELPQSFETSEALAARAAWNTLTPRQSQPPAWESLASPDAPALATASQLRLFIKGVSSNIKPGDPLLIDGAPDGPLLYRAIEVEADADNDRTRLELAPWAEVGAATITGIAPSVNADAMIGELEALIARAPLPGVNATNIVNELNAVLARLHATRSAALIDESLAAAVSRVHTTRTDPLLEGSTRLLPWLAEVERQLESMRAELGQAFAGDGDGQPAADTDAQRVKLLTKQPVAPLSNATRLRRTLSDSFGEKSDAAFKILGAVEPDLRATLPTAWANYEAASLPPQLEVHAFRLKAGLFGRNFPQRQETITRRQGSAGPNGSGEPSDTTETRVIGEWEIVSGADSREEPDVIFLDASYDGILPGSWLALDFSAIPLDAERQVQPAPFVAESPQKLLLTRAATVNAKISRSEYGGSGDTTKIALRGVWISITPNDNADQTIINNDFQVIRGTAVLAQSEKLELAEQPILTPVCFADPASEYLELDGFYADLEPGRFVVVSGERTDIPATTGVEVSEVAMIVDVVHDVRRSDAAVPLLNAVEGNGDPRGHALRGDRVHTFVRLDKALAFCYRRDTVTIHANVVKATHGETRDEVLGSGDGSKAFASFELKQRPLTYVPASTPDGIESTLEVFVDGVRWKEVTDFIARGPKEHIYLTRTDNEGRTTAQFGDGYAGARPPTGVENIRAVYRNGIGKGGNVRARQVSLLSSRPLGVKEVINPLRASGGADRETRDQARDNAPLAVQALDRLVSVTDYADFARTFAGIGKAVAAELSDSRRTVVHVTVAGADDIPIDVESDLFINLHRSLRDFGDPFQPVTVALRELLLLVVEAGVKILPDYQWEIVVAALRTALLDAFGFQRRNLGQDVVRSEILRVIQSVRGVDWVDLDVFGAVSTSRLDPTSSSGYRLATPDEISADIRNLVDDRTTTHPQHRVPVRTATPTGTGILPAQLALLTPAVPATLALNQIP